MRMMNDLKPNNLVSARKNLLSQRHTTNGTLGLGDNGELNFNFQVRSKGKKFRNELFNFFIEYFCLKEKVHLKEFLEVLERNIIVKTLSKFNGSQKEAAKFLGLRYTTLHEKVKKYNIHFRKEPCEELLWSETIE